MIRKIKRAREGRRFGRAGRSKQPGRPQSTLRPVPPEIPRPEYAETGLPTPERRMEIKSPTEIEGMRAAGRVARAVLDEVLEAVRPGITTDALDLIAHEGAVRRGAYPSPLNYQGFPKSLCTSINEVVCHGIPEDRVLLEGDIINCDVTVYFGGFHGDCSETVFVGTPTDDAVRLVRNTYECMMKGIEAVEVGKPINEVGRAIEAHATPAGYSVVRAFTGHGIGRHFHQAPQVLHYFDAGARTVVRSGMTFTVEPMINVGTFECEVLGDGWTAVTVDGSLSAQFEHTLLVTDSGIELLTGGDGPPFFERQLQA